MGGYNFLFEIYGVRGSYPIAPPEGTKIGGNTTCVMARTANQIVIFDAGSGIIPLGKRLVPEILAYQKEHTGPFHLTIMFTHTHIDHLLGLPFFAPIYMPQVHLHLIGPSTVGINFEEILSTQVQPQYFPLTMNEFRSQKSFYNLTENTFVYFDEDNPQPHVSDVRTEGMDSGQFRIHTMKYYFHPKDGTYLFRAEWKDKKIVFATDIEGYQGGDHRLIQFAHKADLLVHDAQYNLEQYHQFCGYGHSSYAMACDTANQAEVKELLLFHHDPNNDDKALFQIESEAKKLFPNSQLAKEGWQLKW